MFYICFAFELMLKDITGGLVLIGKAAVLKTAAGNRLGVRVPRPPFRRGGRAAPESIRDSPAKREFSGKVTSGTLWRGGRAAEGARLLSEYPANAGSWVQIPPSPLKALL